MNAPLTQKAEPALAEVPACAPYSPGYTRYAMWLLLGIYIANFLDRQIITILAEPIKHDLGLDDWHLGLLSGLAFAMFYTLLGIPIARIAERRNRPVIIGASVAVWSAFTALGGLAQNFIQLVLFRVGVGVGEAGCTPPAHSLIVDYVPREKRASALAFYAMGTPIGTLLGLALGGLVADAYGWRVAFLIAGAPGLVFAVLAFTTLREPRRQMAKHAAHLAANAATFGETMAYLARRRTFWLVSVGGAIKAFIAFGAGPFTASFFLRNHSVEVAALADQASQIAGFQMKSIGFLGLALGLVSGLSGALGALCGGWLSDRLGARDLRAWMLAPAAASLLSIPVFILAVTTPQASVALCLMALNGFMGTLWFGPVYGTAQSVVPPHMRATAAAVLLFIVNLLGFGLGPITVGATSDIFNYGFGLGPAEGVRWALVVGSLFGVGAFGCFWAARKTIREETLS
ncbi:spinster family MFS transporter [Phenylobacterium sp.]|uniref:spinster family MFS transporter n=1 Tax=Phenylobacterium sp. TaxID=1871053 RepID=UPI002FC9AD24